MYMNCLELFLIFSSKNGQKLMVGNHQNVHDLLQMVLVTHFKLNSALNACNNIIKRLGF